MVFSLTHSNSVSRYTSELQRHCTLVYCCLVGTYHCMWSPLLLPCWYLSLHVVTFIVALLVPITACGHLYCCLVGTYHCMWLPLLLPCWYLSLHVVTFIVALLVPITACAVVPPVTSIRGLLKKPEVKTQAHSSVQLTAPCFPVSFQSLLPANKKL